MTTKVKHTTNTKARHYVQNQQPFIGSNLYSENIGSLYIVYSYGRHWPLFVYDAYQGLWYENEDKYRVSTSKQHRQAHPCCDTEKRSCGWLKNLIAMTPLTVEQDGRYQIAEEYVGQAEPQFVARFCGEFIGCAPNYDEALAVATVWQDAQLNPVYLRG